MQTINKNIMAYFLVYLCCTTAILPINLFAGECGYNQCVGTGPWNTISPSYNDVNYCVNTCATSGDTVNVTSGSAKWPSQLIITKAISIIGPGADSITIESEYLGTGTRNDNSYYLVVYQPSSPDDTLFRLSGFKFDMGWSSGFIALRNSSITPSTKNRIDNNIIINANQSIHLKGHLYGVVDNNAIIQENRPGISISNYGENSTTWNNFVFSFGSENNMYYEDNTITLQDYIDHGLGGRSCYRYNTFIYTHPTTGAFPLIDAHGNMGEGGNNSTMGFEFYGNKITSVYNTGIGMIDQRGGKALVFYNDVISVGAVSAKVREEVGDHYNPVTSIQPQHVSDTYFWINKKNNGTEITSSLTENDCADSVVSNNPCPTAEDAYSVDNNDELHNYTASFNGSSGMGCGTLAEMNAITTCTEGTAFWATSQGNCSDLTGYVGAGASEIQGTLYRCNATGDGWDIYYTPYTYPHPLRGPFAPSQKVGVGSLIKNGEGSTIKWFE